MARIRHLPLVLPLVVACASAAGGAKTDSGADVAQQGDGGADDASSEACALPPDADAPTWSALYTDFFGPSGTGNCSLKSGCHADDQGGGSLWICGPTKDTCWQGMQGNVNLCDPGASKVLAMLRKTGDTTPGKMPQEPATVSFSDTDLARIRAWIAAGAKND